MGIKLADVFLNVEAEGERQVEGMFGRLRGSANSLVQGMGLAIGQTAVGMVGKAAGAVSGFVGGMVSGNAAFEQYNTQFGVMLGSSEAANQRMQELAEFGAKTPFELPGVVEADRILQGFGLHSEEAAQQFGYAGEDIRTIAGDVASGTGSSFQELAGLIGRFSAGATGEAISRMQELGIANRKELAELGLEFSKSGELLSPLPESMEVVLGLMESKYGGMMDAQSSTFTGMASNLQDWKDETIRRLGEPIFDVAKDQLSGLLDTLASPQVMAAVDTFATTLATGIGTAVTWLVNTGIPGFRDFVGVIQEFLDQHGQRLLTILTGVAAGFAAFSVISTVVGWITGFIATIGAMSGAITAAGGVISAIVAILGGPLTIVIGLVAAAIGLLAAAWANNWGGIREKTQTALTFIQTIIQTVLAGIQAFWNQHGATILMAAQTVWTAIKSAINTALTVIKIIFAAFKSAFEGDWRAFGENLRKAFDTAWDAIKTAFNTAKEALLTALGTLITNAIDKFNNTDWAALGRNIITGLINGLNGMAGRVADKLQEVAQNAWEAWQGFWDSSSPSQRAIDSAREDIGGGYVIGFDRAQGDLQRAMAGLGAAAERAFNPTLAGAGGAAGGGGGVTLVFDYTNSIITNQSDLERIIDDRLREHGYQADSIQRTR